MFSNLLPEILIFPLLSAAPCSNHLCGQLQAPERTGKKDHTNSCTSCAFLLCMCCITLHNILELAADAACVQCPCCCVCLLACQCHKFAVRLRLRDGTAAAYKAVITHAAKRMPRLVAVIMQGIRCGTCSYLCHGMK
jgi:hypothetical protein